jgi:hypothetical protein
MYCMQPFIWLIRRHEPSLVCQLVSDKPFLYFPAALISEATRFTILGDVALFYNISL